MASEFDYIIIIYNPMASEEQNLQYIEHGRIYSSIKIWGKVHSGKDEQKQNSRDVIDVVSLRWFEGQ